MEHFWAPLRSTYVVWTCLIAVSFATTSKENARNQAPGRAGELFEMRFGNLLPRSIWDHMSANHAVLKISAANHAEILPCVRLNSVPAQETDHKQSQGPREIGRAH